ncbi:16S rRNA (adenine(1518)-N(6)/adenine(1519)-N(6))-dimethyltransferase RsmA [Patescibacteria group bacterium]
MSLPAQNISNIKKLCHRFDIRPQRQAGQNFIIKASFNQDVIISAELTESDQVLEIGAGFGWLTNDIAEKVNKVVAVELEKRFIPWLEEEMPANVDTIKNDIFKINLNKLLKDNNYKLISYLPYNITSLVFRNFLTLKPRPSKLVLVIQQEVADRIVAPPGKHSKLSILVQRYSKPRIVKKITAENFWPKPKVNSALIVCDLNSYINPEDDDLFWQVVSRGFAAKRKLLINNLSSGLQLSKKMVENWLETLGIPQNIRPQQLSISQWNEIIEKFKEIGKNI